MSVKIVLGNKGDDFHSDYIEENQEITIPENQQLIIYNKLTIDGLLNIEGTLVII